MQEIDEDITRELMTRATADLFAPPGAAAAAIRRQRQHRLRNRVVGVAGTAAAAGLAAGTLATAGSGHPVPGQSAVTQSGTARAVTLTAAQRTLFGLRDAAAATPARPAGMWC
jgi:hypothetical protein